MTAIPAAANIIEPHIIGDYRRRDRAEGVAEDLHRAGLLVGSIPNGSACGPLAATHVLQCRFSWAAAESIAADLAAADLLRTEA